MKAGLMLTLPDEILCTILADALVSDHVKGVLCSTYFISRVSTQFNGCINVLFPIESRIKLRKAICGRMKGGNDTAAGLDRKLFTFVYTPFIQPSIKISVDTHALWCLRIEKRPKRTVFQLFRYREIVSNNRPSETELSRLVDYQSVLLFCGFASMFRRPAYNRDVQLQALQLAHDLHMLKIEHQSQLLWYTRRHEALMIKVFSIFNVPYMPLAARPRRKLPLSFPVPISGEIAVH